MLSLLNTVIPRLTTATRRCHKTFRFQKKCSIHSPRAVERKKGEVGTGGRSSIAGTTVAVFGAGGFLGRYVVTGLGANGVRTYVGNRGDEFEMRHLKTAFDLGRYRVAFYSPRDTDSMREVIADADIVLNLVGKTMETKMLVDTPKFPFFEVRTNFSLQDANVTIPRTIAELCAEMQVDNLIHFSCMSASPDSNSEYARTKYEGECAVKEVFPWATIVKPTQVFGHEDRLLNYYARHPNHPFIDDGSALTQPVYVGDVAEVVARIVGDAASFEGKSIHLFGPADYTHKELAQFVYDITSQETNKFSLPKSWVKMLFASNPNVLARNPWLTPDKVELWSEDCVAAMSEKEYDRQKEILTLKSFGIKATPIEKVAFNYLHRFRKGGHFLLAEGYHGNYEEKGYQGPLHHNKDK